MRVFFVLLMLIGISRAEGGPSRLQGIRLHIPNLVVFSAEEIGTMEAGIAGKEEKNLPLSDGRAAMCKDSGCQIEGKGYRANLSRADLAKFSTILKKAQREGKEASLREGEITLHCAPEKCAVDLTVDDDKPRGVNVKTKPKTNLTGDLITALIDGVLKGLAP